PAPHDDVDEPRLVLEGEERDTAGRPRPLAADHEPDVVEYAAGAPLGDLFGARDVAAPQLAPERFEGVPAGAVHARAVVPQRGLAGREHGKARLLRGGGDVGGEREAIAHLGMQAAQGPDRIASIDAVGAE